MHNDPARLDVLPPFRLDFTAWALRRLPINRVDRFEKGVYSRTVVLFGNPFEVSVTQPSTEESSIEIGVKGAKVTERVRSEAAALVKKMLGLAADLSPFYRMARADDKLRPLVSRFRGLKPPRFPTLFEGVVNGIACQQLSLSVGISLLNRLAEVCGPAFEPGEEAASHAFPAPGDVRGVPPSYLREMGFSTRKAEFLLDVSRAVCSRELDLEGLASASHEKAVQSLMSVRGIGRWTAEYVLLRGKGDLSTFPGDDVGGMNKLARLLGISTPLSYGEVEKITSRWQPFAGLVYFHLLLDDLARRGHVLPWGPVKD
jgi:DNA-3-methyladenine glycosylase II